MSTILTEQQMQMTVGQYCKTIGKPWKTKILLMPRTTAKTNNEQVEIIKSVICKVFGTDFETINTTSRRREAMETRKAIMYFVRKELDMPLISIGALFKSRKVGGLDHSSVIWACTSYENLMGQNGYKTRHKKIVELLAKEL